MRRSEPDGGWPPLWTVPLLVLLAVVAAVYAAVVLGSALGWIVLVPLGWFVWWIQRRADRHVRRRQLQPRQNPAIARTSYGWSKR